MRPVRYFQALVLTVFVSLAGKSETPIEYQGGLTAGAGTGEFAPYYISSLQGGRFTGDGNLQVEALVKKSFDESRRFSYGFGADFVAGWGSGVDYERYESSTGDWTEHAVKPSAVWIQQLYGQVKYRSVFLTVGMKEYGSALLDQTLTSGDLVESGNARPIPQIRVGFIDFQDIPFTNGWLQIQGEIGYGKFMDDGWAEKQFNFYNGQYFKDEYYNYKRCYFRTNPRQPFSVTVGMQAAGEFGGHVERYVDGRKTITFDHKVTAKTIIKMLLPTQDGVDGFYTGNHLGSWDLKARYRLKNGCEISGYFEWPFEDGSGIGKQNGWDGLWGLQYRSSRRGIVSGAVVEYMDFTNQSGPIHMTPDDYDGCNLPGHVSGSDDYYNNAMNRSWCNYGHSIGTPALMAPCYNVDGYNKFVANAMRGFHIAVEGAIAPRIDYVVKGGYRKAKGNGYFVLPEPIHLTSVMARVSWRPKDIDGLSVDAALELDRGNMPSNACGAMVSVRYNGRIGLKK